MPENLNDPLAVFESVVKRHGDLVALDRCNTVVPRGKVLGLAGPNGAGKSTFARLLLGFSLPSSGSVTVNGRDAVSHRLAEGVGYAPEEVGRPWRCTVREVLGLRVTNAGRTLEHDPVVAALGVASLLDKRVDRLSKGEWRLSVVAVALVGTPSLVVLDEPDSGLDPDALDRLGDAVRVALSCGATVVILSHNLDELQRLCHRIQIITRGTLGASFERAQFESGGMRQLSRDAVTVA